MKEYFSTKWICSIDVQTMVQPDKKVFIVLHDCLIVTQGLGVDENSIYLIRREDARDSSLGQETVSSEQILGCLSSKLYITVPFDSNLLIAEVRGHTQGLMWYYVLEQHLNKSFE